MRYELIKWEQRWEGIKYSSVEPGIISKHMNQWIREKKKNLKKIIRTKERLGLGIYVATAGEKSMKWAEKEEKKA